MVEKKSLFLISTKGGASLGRVCLIGGGEIFLSFLEELSLSLCSPPLHKNPFINPHDKSISKEYINRSKRKKKHIFSRASSGERNDFDDDDDDDQSRELLLTGARAPE